MIEGMIKQEKKEGIKDAPRIWASVTQGWNCHLLRRGRLQEGAFVGGDQTC